MIEGIIILIAVVDRAIEELFAQIGLLEGREGTRAAQAPPHLIHATPAPTRQWPCQAASLTNLPV
jgi:hypothetical protein